MSEEDLIVSVAIAMRQAYADHTGEGCCSWSAAGDEPKQAWLECATVAVDVCSRALATPGHLRMTLHTPGLAPARDRG
jgi:hypothetical protein